MMKHLLLSLLFIFSVYCDCPLPGFQFAANTEFEASFATGFKVTVSCGGIATGISIGGNGQFAVALYSDNNGHPATNLATSTSYSSSDGVTVASFATPVSVSAGNYWLFAVGNAIIPGCLGCSAVANQQVYGLYGVNDLRSDYSQINFDYFGVGQLGYSMWLDVSTGTACSADWECASSGANYDFATCVNGFCACAPNFIGSAIPEDVCRCDTASGKHLAYDENSNPFCLNAGVCEVGDLIRIDLCSDYTENFMFVECDGGQCQCVDGFQGTATVSDQCRCDNTLTWTANGPVCSND